ncbi:MAG: aminomethyl-transferring glycine dehydrogenase subunit GcvPB, partial [SAR324 cluster bacterium]|nr:aminomethyl-transferring glycine dehydrogenase subunit GcvPB [SAR324 cluster bacterium]
MSAKASGYFHEEPLSFEYPETGHCGVKLRRPDVPRADPRQAMAGAALRDDSGHDGGDDGLRDLPQLSEFDVIRHFTRLSKFNVSIDAAMYPLGSCTMKYNPRINEAVARIPGFAAAHPFMPDELVQGTLEVFHRLQVALAEVTGFPGVSLQPSAGAQGELTGVLLMRAGLKARGEQRRYILVPDSAHGTNPASACIAGFDVKTIRSDGDGCIDLADLRSNMDQDVAGLMLTNPNTLGIFEPEIFQIADLVHG